jgi:hypothetical protein
VSVVAASAPRRNALLIDSDMPTFTFEAKHKLIKPGLKFQSVRMIARPYEIPFQIIGTIFLVSASSVVFHLFRCPRLLRELFPLTAFCALGM